MLTHEVFSVLCGGSGPILPGVIPTLLDNRENLRTPCEWYQHAVETSTADILLMTHDDVAIHEDGWLPHVMSIFENQPDAVCVGLGGAAQLGHENLYKRPYQLNQLARQGYVSNQTDYDIHGGRLTGIAQVAVVDAFFMAVRRQFLLDIGGWPTEHLSHHCLDLWLACEVARHRKTTFAIGLRTTHFGGGSSTKKVYSDAKWLQGGDMAKDHQLPHKWLYEAYRDVLPVKVVQRG